MAIAIALRYNDGCWNIIIDDVEWIRWTPLATFAFAFDWIIPARSAAPVSLSLSRSLAALYTVASLSLAPSSPIFKGAVHCVHHRNILSRFSCWLVALFVILLFWSMTTGLGGSSSLIRRRRRRRRRRRHFDWPCATTPWPLSWLLSWDQPTDERKRSGRDVIVANRIVRPLISSLPTTADPVPFHRELVVLDARCQTPSHRWFSEQSSRPALSSVYLFIYFSKLRLVRKIGRIFPYFPIFSWGHAWLYNVR